MKAILILAILAVVGMAWGQTDTTGEENDRLDKVGRIDRPIIEKAPKRFIAIYKNDTVEVVATLYRKNNTGHTGTKIVKMKYVKDRASEDTLHTVILRNIAACFGETTCDTCTKR